MNSMNRALQKEKIKILQATLRLKVIEVLLAELKFRRFNDIKYSNRKFAADIGMNPVHLNQGLLNKRGLSREMAEHISRTFNLDYEGRMRFFRLVSACSRSERKRNMALFGLQNAMLKKEKRIN